jgi:hypothetical protein
MADSVSKNYVRAFFAYLRNKDNRQYKITWSDVNDLFGGTVNPSICDMTHVWNSDKIFEWMVFDINTDQSLDYTHVHTDLKTQGQTHDEPGFLVNIAQCHFDDGRYAVLAIGGGDQETSQQAFLSFHDKDRSLIWRCQLRIEESGEGCKWQAGTVVMRHSKMSGKPSVGSIHMKSRDDKRCNEMIFNGWFNLPFYSSTIKKRVSSIGFLWEEDVNAIWSEAIKRGEGGDVYCTVDKDWWSDFCEDTFAFDQDMKERNPDNKCSVTPYVMNK